MVEIRIAEGREKRDLLGILARKSAELRERGIPIWDPAEFTEDGMRAKYGEAEYVIGKTDGEAFGGCLLVEQDGLFWPEETANDSLYLHKLVVGTEFGGRGYSKLILAWVKGHAKRRGKRYVRLDYNHSREYLEKLYGSFGFVTVDRGMNAGGFPCTRAELFLE